MTTTSPSSPSPCAGVQDRVLEWRLVGPEMKHGVFLSLPITDAGRKSHPVLRKQLLHQLDSISWNNPAALRESQVAKDALTHVLQQLTQPEVGADLAWFRTLWAEQVQARAHTSPLLLMHECNADHCPLTRERTPTRACALLALMTDVGTHVEPIYDAACEKEKQTEPSERESASMPPFVYVAFAAGGLGYDLQVCRRLYSRGVRNIKFVVVSHTRDFISFLVEQANGAKMLR